MSDTPESPPPEQRYALSYKMEIYTPPEPTPAEDPSRMYAEAVLSAGLIVKPDGAMELDLHHVDGRTGKQMSDNDMFTIWLMLTQRLAQSQTLDDSNKALCLITFKTFTDAMQLAQDVRAAEAAAAAPSKDRSEEPN